MTAPLTYLFDPLCGWCYAAAPQLAKLRDAVGPDKVTALPTGMFAGSGARPMSAAFRDYAWTNDRRIEEMTGQRFTQVYYDQVLSDFSVPFDSARPTRAVALADTLRSGGAFDLLRAIQSARYVDGRDVTNAAVLVDLADKAGFDAGPFAAALDSAETQALAQRLADTAHEIMEHYGMRGVPALLLDDGVAASAIPASAIVDAESGLIESLVEHLR